jgi:ERCC4-type nuclease
MSALKYQQLLARLEDDATGVGAGTVANIRDHFESGDDFLDAAEVAYQEMEFDALEAVDGIGQSSAKEIGLTIADEEGWSDGALFSL